MGVRTKHYDHKLRSPDETQPQNVQEAEGANPVVPEVADPQPPLPPSSAKGKAGKGKKKARSRAKPKPRPAVPVVAEIPKQLPLAPTEPTLKPMEVEVPSVILPAVETATKKPTPSKKSSSKKRKRGGKGKAQQNGNIEPILPLAEEKVEKKGDESEFEGGKSVTTVAPTNDIKSLLSPLMVEVAESSSVAIGKTGCNDKDGTLLEPVSNSGNVLKNGILKANKSLKKGMKNLLERTNKILERSRNCKKPPRKKSPVKPRILPARASARLCVRKNSGEHDQCMMMSDIPLRTVELIKRPLELREPATKLLYMASLSLYPTADPESDTTPIVIISEEIPNSCGKKPKMRSMELPLLPNWRSASFHTSSSRATVLDDPVLLSINSILSPDLKNSNSNGIENKPSRKRKAPQKKQPLIEETAKPTTDDIVLKGKKAKATKSHKQANSDNIANNPNTADTISAVQSLVNDSQLQPIKAAFTPESKPTTLSMSAEFQPLKSSPANQPEKIPQKGSKGSKKSSKQVMTNTILQNTSAVSQQLSNVSNPATNLVMNSFTGNISQLPESSMDLCSSILKYPLDSGLTISPSVHQHQVENQMKITRSTRFVTNSNNQFIPVGTFSFGDKLSVPSSLLSSATLPNEGSQEKQTTTLPAVGSPIVTLPHVNVTAVGVNNNYMNAATQPNKPAKSAPVKRKRKSLETIIKEIPKTKSQNVVGDTSEGPVSEMNMTSNSNILPSINPILAGLMKTPVNKRKRPTKTKAEQARSQPLSDSLLMLMSPMNMQNPVSMTVPLQPAPGNSNMNTTVPQMTKDQGGKPRNKKQKPQFQLPLPLPIPIPPGLLNYTTLVPHGNMQTSNTAPPKPKRQRKPPKPKAPKVTAAILAVPNNLSQQRQPHEIPHHHHQLASIPYLPSHLEAFYHSTPTGMVGNGVEESDMSSMYHNNQDQRLGLDQALDLCVKAQPILKPKKARKAKAPAMKSLLKPMNVEEDGPLNLVMARGIPQGGIMAGVGQKSEQKGSPSPHSTENVKQQGNLENVKQMLARLHTKIAPAINGVQLITIE